MRDFKVEIERCNNPTDLLQIIDDLAVEIERAYEDSDESDSEMRRAHDLELLMRYGEDKLGNLLS